jgi:4'-phosphopantetheinyl transferase EntD
MTTAAAPIVYNIMAIRSPAELFPRGLFGFGSADGPMAAAILHPLERGVVGNAVAKRRGEFAAGRHCARQALGQLGMGFVPILRDAEGCPLWPAAAVGSISHTRHCIVGVAARSDRMKGVGVDVESLDRPFPREVLPNICTRDERSWLQRLAPAQFDAHAYGLFSAKEAVYKCVFGATRKRLAFDDVEIDLDLIGGIFRARLRIGEGLPARASGRIGCNSRHVFTGVWWPRPTFS